LLQSTNPKIIYDEDNDFSRDESNIQQNKLEEMAPEDDESQFYDKRHVSIDKQFGRSTAYGGSHNIVKLESSHFYKTTQEKVNNWAIDPRTSNTKVQDVDVQQELSEKLSEKHLQHVTLEEANLEKSENEEDYEDDFEDYYSQKETENLNDTQKFGQTMQFSISDLNYDKIRDHLSDYSLLLLKTTATSEGVNRKGILEKKTCALLHTLKKLISNSSGFNSDTKMTRREVLGLFITNDIFSYTHIALDMSSKVFELFPNTLIRLLYSSVKRSNEEKPGIKVMQYTIALLNAMSSLKHGRDYLLPNDSDNENGKHMTGLLVKRLVQILNKETSDSLLRQYCIGVLQKFSLRNTAQILLIEHDLIEKMVNLVRQEYQSISDYSLECSMAMLMNLSLRTKGKEKMEKIHAILIPLLKGILMSNSGQIVIYANGILFSIISSEVMRNFIKQTNLADFLNTTRENLRNSLFTNIQEDDEEDISENDKRQLLVQISYIIQKIEEKDTAKPQGLEESRIGFSQTEEQENETEENIIKNNSRPGSTIRGEQDDEEELTDDEELDSTLQDGEVLVNEALLIAEYVQKDEISSEQDSEELDDSKVLVSQTKSPIIQKEPVVFEYQQANVQPEKESDKLVKSKHDVVRASNQDILKHRLEMENKKMMSNLEEGKSRHSKQYQSVNHPIGSYDENTGLVFKTRSKIIRTPQGSEVDKNECEKITFGTEKYNSRPSIPDQRDSIQASEGSKIKVGTLIEPFYSTYLPYPLTLTLEPSVHQVQTSDV